MTETEYLRAEVTRLANALGDIDAIPSWYNRETGEGGFDVDGEEFKLIRDITRNANFRKHEVVGPRVITSEGHTTVVLTHAQAYHLTLLGLAWRDSTIPPRVKRWLYKRWRLLYLAVEGIVK